MTVMVISCFQQSCVLSAGFVLLFLFSFSSYSNADEDIFEPPRIHEQTLSEYTTLGDSNWEMKLRITSYLDSLKSELDSLRYEVESEMNAIPTPMLNEFQIAHEAFLVHADAWSRIQEDIQWVSLQTGELYMGSGYGYTYTWSMCDLIWKRIQCYQDFLEEIRSPDYDGFAMFPGDGSHEVGGY
ncbi:MAG: hypothetical protein KAQ97_10115 [Candidatus Fermentibacteraceae bacterium]|nr:hypothetical protein [Candidatus Fermentibacteraceae bacterium]